MPPSILDAAYWKRIDALLEVALGLPAGERGRWLEGLGPEVQPHKPMIERLLARAGVESDSFMERPVSADLLEEASAGCPDCLPFRV